MPASTDLLERSSDIKQQLVRFAQSSRLKSEFRRALACTDEYRPITGDSDFIRFLDTFVLQHRLPDGHTVVDRFVAAHRELSEQDRAMVLGWKDVVEGVFEVQRRDGEALIVENLVDDLTYRVRSNMGTTAFKPMTRRSFLITRLVPLADEWLISGLTNVMPAANRPEMYQIAAEVAATSPTAVFRNPDKVARGWELQREDRACFVEFFGSDEIVLTGKELAERMSEYWSFRMRTARAKAKDRGASKASLNTPDPDFTLPAHLYESASVALIYDEVDGLNFFGDYALIQEVFDDPTLLRDRARRQHLLDYLKDDSVSPLPFRRLAKRDPAKASQVFGKLLKRPAFSWESDGEALLRRYKPTHFDKPALPSVVPVSERLVKYAHR